jgi:phosphoribosylaminoimidazole (AIR) synthetase
MLRVFNLGIGMVLVVTPDAVASTIATVGTFGHDAVVIGRLEPGAGKVRIGSSHHDRLK